jgi:hypothetical protein
LKSLDSRLRGNDEFHCGVPLDNSFTGSEQVAPGSAPARPEDGLHGRVEGRTTLIQAIVDFLTASFAGMTS